MNSKSELLTPIEDPLGAEGAPELVIGLIGPIGCDLELVINVLEDEIKKINYNSDEVKLSELLLLIDQYRNDLKYATEDERYHAYMKKGTQLREDLGRGDALALLAVNKIREIRSRKSSDPNIPRQRHAYIISGLLTSSKTLIRLGR
ncbi:MAG: hypothetical protein VX741_02790 [Pseudomonadota bacterium]|nr:hypothetical protein [Pseudomonadota bacterium]